MKKSRKKVMYAGVFFLLTILIIVFVYINKEIYIEYEFLETTTQIDTRCKTIFLEQEGAEYSFDEGKTWQKSNYYVVCNNYKYSVIIRDNNKRIITKGKIKISGLRKDGPKIKIDFDKLEKYKNNDNLLEGVTATNDLNENLTNKINYKIIEENKEYLLLEYTIENKNKLTTVARKINKEKNINNENETSIFFEKKHYICKPNEEINTMIITKGKNDDGTYSTVRKFSSNNEKIATIQKYNGKSSKKCDNCLNITIHCKDKGNAKLYAESSTGANITIEIFVKED